MTAYIHIPGVGTAIKIENGDVHQIANGIKTKHAKGQVDQFSNAGSCLVVDWATVGVCTINQDGPASGLVVPATVSQFS